VRTVLSVDHDRVSDAEGLESTQVTAAFEPGSPQEVIQPADGRAPFDLDIEPEDRRVPGLDAYLEKVSRRAVRMIVVRSARAEMRDHRGLASPFVA
jgi:hypothetical protein